MSKSFLLRLFIDGASRVVTMLFTILLARILTVDDFGKFTFGLSYTVAFVLLADGGIHVSFLREFGRSEEHKKVWDEFFGLKLVLIGGAWFLSAALSFWLWPWDDYFIPIALTGYMMGNSISDFFHQACNAAERIQLSAWISGAQRGACILVAVGALVVSTQLSTLTGALCFGSFWGTWGGFWYLRRRMKFITWPHWNARAWFDWWKISFPSLIMGLAFGLTMRLGLLMLPYLGRIHDTGIYGAAQRLLDVGNIIPSSFMMIALPRFSKTLKSSFEEFRVQARKAAWAVLAGALLIVVAGQFAARPVVLMLFGNKYEAAVPLVQVLSGVNAIVVANYFCITLLLVLNRQKKHVVHELVCLFTAGYLTQHFTRNYGPAGAAWALVLTQVLMLGLLVIALWREGIFKPVRATP